MYRITIFNLIDGSTQVWETKGKGTRISGKGYQASTGEKKGKRIKQTIYRSKQVLHPIKNTQKTPLKGTQSKKSKASTIKKAYKKIRRGIQLVYTKKGPKMRYLWETTSTVRTSHKKRKEKRKVGRGKL